MASSPPEQNDGPRLRALKPTDAAVGFVLSSEAGWNQTEADWRFLLEWGRGYAVEDPQDGVIATGLYLPFGDSEAWVAMVLVREAHRGRGHARKILAACLDAAAAESRAVLLDATPMGEGLYRKLGFAGEETLVRVVRSGETPLNLAASTKALAIGSVPADLDQVAALDARVLGGDRSALVRYLCEQAPETAWWVRDADGGAAACVLGRSGRFAHQIGPLCARDEEEARALLARSLTGMAGAVVMDVPVRHTRWLAWLASQGFEEKRRFRRMGRNGARLATDWARYFAAGGPDLA